MNFNANHPTNDSVAPKKKTTVLALASLNIAPSIEDHGIALGLLPLGENASELQTPDNYDLTSGLVQPNEPDDKFSRFISENKGNLTTGAAVSLAGLVGVMVIGYLIKKNMKEHFFENEEMEWGAIKLVAVILSETDRGGQTTPISRLLQDERLLKYPVLRDQEADELRKAIKGLLNNYNDYFVTSDDQIRLTDEGYAVLLPGFRQDEEDDHFYYNPKFAQTIAPLLGGEEIYYNPQFGLIQHCLNQFGITTLLGIGKESSPENIIDAYKNLYTKIPKNYEFSKSEMKSLNEVNKAFESWEKLCLERLIY